MRLLPLAAGPEAARPLVPAGAPAGDCLAALEAVTAGLRRFAGLAAVSAHEVAAHLTGGRWLAPVSPALGVQHEPVDMAGVIVAFVIVPGGPGSGYPVMNRAFPRRHDMTAADQGGRGRAGSARRRSRCGGGRWSSRRWILP